MKVQRNDEYIKAAFEMYQEVINEIGFKTNIPKREPELFAKLIELNNKHLIENLDKALVLVIEDNKEK